MSSIAELAAARLPTNAINLVPSFRCFFQTVRSVEACVCRTGRRYVYVTSRDFALDRGIQPSFCGLVRLRLLRFSKKACLWLILQFQIRFKVTPNCIYFEKCAPNTDPMASMAVNTLVAFAEFDTPVY